MGIAIDQNPSSNQWFDNWGEGPFTLDDVARYVQANPAAADHFHTAGWRTYRQYMERDRPGRVN